MAIKPHQAIRLTHHRASFWVGVGLAYLMRTTESEHLRVVTYLGHPIQSSVPMKYDDSYHLGEKPT
jgi:hypothetical protein